MIESVRLPHTLKRIEKLAFGYCERLKNVEIPSCVEYIGERCFENIKIDEIVLPSALKEIGETAFEKCRKLRRVIFAPGSVLEKIGSECFSNTAIERIVIPKGVEEIPDMAFEECENLREVVLEDGIKLKAFGTRAFFKCASLRKIHFPNELERIGIECFASSGLERAVLRAGVKEIGAEAF